MGLIERFWDKVDMYGECWEWTGSISNCGYGLFWDKKTVSAHRFSYAIMNGPIPEGLCVCHHCDNKKCVRPSHLFLGTSTDNQQDSVAKGRKVDRKGEKHPLSRLAEDDVHEIRRLYSLGLEQTLIAKMWKVCFQHVSDIVRRKRWGHI